MNWEIVALTLGITAATVGGAILVMAPILADELFDRPYKESFPRVLAAGVGIIVIGALFLGLGVSPG